MMTAQEFRPALFFLFVAVVNIVRVIAKESPISTIHGNITGLKPAEMKMLERLYRRKMPPDTVITPEAARALSEASARDREAGRPHHRPLRQRPERARRHEQGHPHPRSFGAPARRRRLRGVRFIHTHLKDQPLNQEDLTDLALLRLDMIAALAARPDGLPGNISIAHLVPPNPEEKLYEVLPPQSVHGLDMDAAEFIADIERQMERAQAAVEVAKKDRAILVSVSKKSRHEQEESVEELKELARSDGITVLDTVIQRLHDINPKYLLG